MCSSKPKGPSPEEQQRAAAEAAARQAETDRIAELQRVEAARLAEAQRQAEAQRAAEQARQAELQRQAEAARVAQEKRVAQQRMATQAMSQSMDVLSARPTTGGPTAAAAKRQGAQGRVKAPTTSKQLRIGSSGQSSGVGLNIGG